MDPVRDLDIINEELRLKDEEFFMKVFEDVERKCVRGSEKKLKPEYVRRTASNVKKLCSFAAFVFQEILCKIKKVLVDEKRHIRFGEWNGNDVSQSPNNHNDDDNNWVVSPAFLVPSRLSSSFGGWGRRLIEERLPTKSRRRSECPSSFSEVWTIQGKNGGSRRERGESCSVWKRKEFHRRSFLMLPIWILLPSLIFPSSSYLLME